MTKGFTCPLRGHTKDKAGYVEVSKDLSQQRGETEHEQMPNLCRPAYLFSSALYAFRVNQSLRPSSQSLCGRTSECPGSPVFSSPLQGLP